MNSIKTSELSQSTFGVLPITPREAKILHQRFGIGLGEKSEVDDSEEFSILIPPSDRSGGQGGVPLNAVPISDSSRQKESQPPKCKTLRHRKHQASVID